MRLEQVKEELQAEMKRKVYNEMTQRLEEERKKHAWQYALKRRQANQNYEMLLKSIQSTFATSIFVFNVFLILNQLSTSAP